jgi:hypothetical protein
LGAITVWACGAAGRLLWPGQRLAQAPMVVVLAIPTFVALAGSVNNDGLAVMCGSLLITLLLAGALERGAWARPVLWAVGAAVLVGAGVETKRTFLPLAVLVVVAVAIRLRKRPAVTVGVLVACVLAVALAFAADSSPRLALWQQQTASVSYRCHDRAARSWAICLPGGAPSIVQKVPLVRAQKMEGAPFELTFSARSDGQAQAMVIDVATPRGVLAAQRVELGTEAEPVVLTGVAPAHLDAVWVEMGAPAGGTVYVREMRLATTRFPALGGVLQPARNEVRNGSGAQAVASAPGFLPDSLQREVNSAIDAVAGVGLAPGPVFSSASILYGRMATAFAMFWATVGWQIPPPLLPVGLNWALAVLTAVAIGGAAVALLRTRLPAFSGALLLFTATVMTVAVTFRNIPPDEPGVINGRYLFPAITAFVVILAAGWHHLWPGTERGFRAVTRASVPVIHVLFLALVFVPFLTK